LPAADTAPAAAMEQMVVMENVLVLRERRETLAARAKQVVMVPVVNLAPPTQMETFVPAKGRVMEMEHFPERENAIVWLDRLAVPVNCVPRIVTVVPASFVLE